jgi:hypothetical protein
MRIQANDLKNVPNWFCPNVLVFAQNLKLVQKTLFFAINNLAGRNLTEG